MTVVAVDWSGARHPARKIWVAEASGEKLRRLEPVDSRDGVLAIVREYMARKTPVTVGLDFSFSLPHWYCTHVGAGDGPALWHIARAEGERWLHQCCWPFWGRPGTKKPALEGHLRRTEERVAATFRTSPKSTFQIGGAGAVGTGSIRGMPYLAQLRRSGCAVWPFDAPAHVTVVEIYPRALTGSVVKSVESARRAYLARKNYRWSAAHVRAAVTSEDAFDAAVSAMVMARCSAEFQQLEAGDTLSQVEGEIWVPGRGRAVIGAAPNAETPAPPHRGSR